MPVLSTCDQRKWRERQFGKFVSRVNAQTHCPSLKEVQQRLKRRLHAESIQRSRLFISRPNWIPPPPHPQPSVSPPPFGSKGVDTFACEGDPIPTKRRHSGGTLCILLSLYGYNSSHQRQNPKLSSALTEALKVHCFSLCQWRGCGSGSGAGSVIFWTSRILIRNYLYGSVSGSGSFYQAKKFTKESRGQIRSRSRTSQIQIGNCKPKFKGTVSRDGYFFEGLNILNSAFFVCADGCQGLSKDFQYHLQLLTLYMLL